MVKQIRELIENSNLEEPQKVGALRFFHSVLEDSQFLKILQHNGIEQWENYSKALQEYNDLAYEVLLTDDD